MTDAPETPRKRGRPATGSVVYRDGRWYARVTMPDKTRPFIPIQADIPENDRPRAEALAAMIAKRVREPGAVAPDAPETFDEWFQRLLTHRKERAIKSVSDDLSRYNNHIKPHLGHLAPCDVTRDHIEDIVSVLDDAIVAHHMSWKMAAHIWSLIRIAFAEATNSKNKSLRCLKVDPTIGVRGPERGAAKVKQYLYPSELRQLLESPRVRHELKIAVAFAVYSYLRAGEMFALEMADINRARGYIDVHRSIDRGRDSDDTTVKTPAGVRKVPIEPTLDPLIAALIERGTLPRLPKNSNASIQLRAALKRAGVDRPELFRRSSSHKPITWHDLRATGITWRAARGDDPLSIMEAAGHSNFNITQKYIRMVRAMVDNFGDVFFPLPLERMGFQMHARISDRITAVDETPSLGHLGLRIQDAVMARDWSTVAWLSGMMESKKVQS